MPWYDYKCGVCGFINGLIRPFEEMNNLVLCEKCSSVAHQVFFPASSKKFAEQKGYWSDTMGTSPLQVAEERLAHPAWKFHNDGRLWVENLQDQRKKAKTLGMTCLDDVCG